MCSTCGRDVEPENEVHSADMSRLCVRLDGTRPWRYEHTLGGALITFDGKRYLSAIDQNEPWRLRAYFLCELPESVDSIARAYDCLKPSRVREAEAQGLEVRRSGGREIFFLSGPQRKT